VLVIRGHEVLRQFDALLGQTALLMLREMGVAIESSCRGAQLVRLPEGTFELELHDGRRLGPLDSVIWAVGRVPNVEELALSRAGVHTDPARVHCDRRIPGDECGGDLRGRRCHRPHTAHAGRHRSGQTPEPIACSAASRSGGSTTTWCPTVIFGHPPIGSIGLSEAQARARHGSAVRVYTSSFVPLYHAMTVRKPHTHMKLVTVGRRSASSAPM
jgi:glutathione reductase (NADPH)